MFTVNIRKVRVLSIAAIDTVIWPFIDTVIDWFDGLGGKMFDL